MGEYASHLDPTLPLTLEAIERLKPGTIARLRKNGRAHMGRARKLNKAFAELNKDIEDPRFHHAMIVIEDFDPIAVYQDHDWTCPKCFKRVDVTKGGQHPDSCVLGHTVNFANKGGHVPENCGPWHWSCNSKEAAGIEIPREAKVRRHRRARGVMDGKPGPKPKYKNKIAGRSSWPSKSQSRWPKGQKIQSRNNLRKGKKNGS